MKTTTNLFPSLRTLVVLLSVTTTLPAATLNWTNAGGGAFGTAANWSPNLLPGSGDWARLTNGTVVTIADGNSYTVSNLWVAARNFINAGGTLRITSGSLDVAGLGNAANRPQIGVGVNAVGRIEVDGGTFSRSGANFMYLGGNGGTGYLALTNGNAFIDSIRVGSDNDNTLGNGTGHVIVAGGLLVVTNQWTIGRDRETGNVLVTGGEAVNHALNFFTGAATDDFMTIAGQSISTGLVTVATGGKLRAEGGIRIAQASDAGLVADATLRLTGGHLVTQRIFQGATAGVGIPKLEFDGGIVEAVYATNALGFIYSVSSSSTSSNLSVRLKAGGIAINSAGYDLRVGPGVVQDPGSPGGGITKSNLGALRLLGTNTYTGPTVVEGGGLMLTTASTGGGAATANDGANFGAIVSYAGSSLSLSSLTLNAGSGTNGLDFDLGVLGNPIAPVMTAANLTVNRTNKVNIAGAALSIGQFTLIQYTTGTGVTADQFEIGSLPNGVDAQLVLEPNLVKLDITAAPSLHWNGDVSSDWDLSTLNWLDLSGTPTAKVYSDGNAVQFDDGATNALVNLIQTVLPAAVTVTNQTTNFTFTGVGAIGGATGLLKQGAGILTMATLNTYAGATVISAGTLQLGGSEVIPHGSGKGNVTVNGTLDLNGFTENINGLTGNGVIDNASGGTSTLTVGNQGNPGTFSGLITNSGGGTLGLTKTGNNQLLLSNTNGHSGGTRISAGLVLAANDHVLGVGPLTLNGGGPASDGSTARTFTNPVIVSASSTLGSGTYNGFLTLSGLITFNPGPFNLVCDSDVLLNGGSTGAGWNKAGTATMTIQGQHSSSSVLEVNNGKLVLDGVAMTNTAGGFRVNSTIASGVARAVVTNGTAIVLLASGSNFRSGYDGNVTATNYFDIAGVLRVPNGGTANGDLRMGRAGTIGFARLLPGGDAEFRGISGSDTAIPAAYNEFNFDGGILRARLNNPTYMQGLSNAFVRAGGAIIDTAGANIGIAQNLQDGGGGGGLTKLGAGNLYLNGVNTYTGGTVVSNGGFGGTGTINGTVLVTSGGTLVPGSSVGTLTVNGALTLEGATWMELSRDSGTPAGDLVFASTFNRGGSLVISNSGITSLRSGDSFDLFNWTTVSGAFGSVSTPPLLPGLFWNTSNLAVDGTLSIGGTVIPPQFNPPDISGGNVNLSGTGGVAGGSYYILTADDVALPVSSWTPLATNVFDGSGNFSFADVFNPDAPQRFYLIAIP